MKKASKYPLSILKFYGIIFILILAYIIVFGLIDSQSIMVTPWIMVAYIWYVIGIGWVPLLIGYIYGQYKDKKLQKTQELKN